jgi:hypothetical protein
MTVESWLVSAIADADRRGLPALKPLLETLGRSTAALRIAHASVAGATVSSCADAPPSGGGRPAGVAND